MKWLGRRIWFVSGECDGGSGWRVDHFDCVWCRHLERLKPAMAMIDDRLKFNQNGARSVFGEVNRLISQAVLPSSLSFAPCFFLSTRPLWTPMRHSSLSHQHLAPLPPSSSARPSFPRHLLLHASTTSHMTHTIWHIPRSREEEHQSAPSTRLISSSISRHKTLG